MIVIDISIITVAIVVPIVIFIPMLVLFIKLPKISETSSICIPANEPLKYDNSSFPV
jgi:hypothetical protein